MSDEAAEPVETTETEIDETEDSQPQEDPQEETPAEPEKPKARGVQKRLDELTALRRDAERERDYWRQMAMREPEKPKDDEPKGKPELEAYGSYDEYVEALTDWKYDQRIQSDNAKRQQDEQEKVRTAQVQTFQQRAQAARAVHEDFDQVVGNPSLPISEAMAEAAYASEKGPELLYYLGQNPEEAARIHTLSPYAQAMELGKLELTLSRPSRTQTGAPDPIEAVSGVGGKQTVDPDKMTMEEWKVWRANQLKER